jgi:tetratricopeptide (TPR) repeat protein
MEQAPEKTIETSEHTPPEHAEIVALINQGDLVKAAERLNAVLTQTKLTNSHRLWVYSSLIRIAAETRALEKIATYIEKIKAIPLETIAEKRTFAHCLFAMGTAWHYSGSYDKARESFHQALAIAKSVGDLKLECDIRITLADIDRAEGNYASVTADLENLREICEITNDPEKLGNYWILAGNVHRKSGRYREALSCFESAKEIFQSNKSSSDYHYVLWAIGTCYAALEDKEKAVIYLDLARNNDQGMPFWRISILSSLTVAELYTVVGQYADADVAYQRVAKEVGSDENTYYGRRLLRGQTLLHIRKGEFEPANELIDRLVVVAVKERNQKDIMRLRLLKAEVLLRTGDAVQQDEARDMLQEALAYFRERAVRRHQAVALELLSRLDSRSGYPSDAQRKVEEMLEIARETSFERLVVRGTLAKLVLQRKLGTHVGPQQIELAETLINKLNAEPERVILSRFRIENYDIWIQELRKLDPHSRRYVNEFFEDFHFIPQQTTDLEIDRNSHYIREKHLGEIPFHNKFTLMRILCLLAETPGKEFSKEQLAKEIWGQEYNPLRHDNNIYININRLRKLIEPNPRESRYIMNGPRGYYFNPQMKVNISSKISDVAPRAVGVQSPSEEL